MKWFFLVLLLVFLFLPLPHSDGGIGIQLIREGFGRITEYFSEKGKFERATAKEIELCQQKLIAKHNESTFAIMNCGQTETKDSPKTCNQKRKKHNENVLIASQELDKNLEKCTAKAK